MARSWKDRKARAAWARIEALGGHGVWEPDMCVVSLARTAVNDEDLSLFHDFPYVHILDLSHTGIIDAGLIHLAGLMALESFDLSHTSIGDAGLAHLARLETLKGLPSLIPRSVTLLLMRSGGLDRRGDHHGASTKGST